MLVRDAGNDGLITLNNEYDFTEWDPTAKTDMQALLSVFDTNRDGKLNAGDADWALFKIMVTNADGTTTLKTMAELGITAINLITNKQEVILSDGSKIAGTATYIKSDGSTGKAADVTLVYDPTGYVVAKTVTVNANGSTTVDNKTYNASGSLANETITTTSADGKSRTIEFDNDGDGVTDRVQTDVKVVNANGSTTRTVQDYDGSGTILARKEVTVTSADLKTITVNRDVNGSGTNDQVETRATGADGSLTVTITDLNDNGSARDHKTTITSADGLGKTIQVDLTGSGVINASRTETTAVAGTGARTETTTDFAGSGTATANKIGSTVTVTSADGSGKTVTSDLDGNGTTDLTTTSVLVRNANGSTTTTGSHANGNGSLRDQAVTDLSADGFSKTTRADIDGNGTYDVTTTEVRVTNGDGSTTETTTVKYANGSRHNQTVETWSADLKTRTTSIDSDGAFDRIETVATVGGNSVDTASVYSGNGLTLLSKAVTTTSANGLVRTSQVDANGDLTFDAVVTSTTVWNADGSSTVTAVSKNGAGTVQIGKTVTTTSADGLSMTVQSYLNAQTTPYKTVTDAKVLNAGGSTTETVTSFAGTSQVQTGRSVIDVSADRLTTTKSYVDSNTLPASIAITVTNTDGTKTQTVSSYSPNGAALLGKTVTSISADSLTTTTTQDANGDGVIDATQVSAKLLNADGTTTTTTTTYAGSGTAAANKTGQSVVNSSGNGLSVTRQTDGDGNGAFDAKMADVIVLNADGSKTETVTSYNGAGTIQTGKTVSTVSDDGLVKTQAVYLSNHTTADMVTSDMTVLNSDGSVVETVSVSSGNGTLQSKSVTTTSGNRTTVTVATDRDGNGVNDRLTTSTTNADGSVTTVTSTYNATGTLTARSTQTVSGNGFSSTVASDLDGNGTVDQSKTAIVALSADGSKTETVSDLNANGSLKDKTIVTASADGLSTTTQWDGAGAGSFTRTRTDVTTVNADGSMTRVISNLNANGTLHDKTTTNTAANGLKVTTTEDVNGDGIVDHTFLKVKNADGSVTSSSMDGTVQSASGRSFGAAHGQYETDSATGLSQSIQYDANGDGLAERQRTDVTVLNADGSTVKTITSATLTGGVASSANPAYTVTTTDKAVITTSANGLSTTTQWDMTGAGSFGESQTDQTVLNADGSITETISTFAGVALKIRTATTTSADGLSKTTQWDTTGSGTYSETATDLLVKNANGSATRTVTNTTTSGALISKSVMTTSADGRTSTIQEDPSGSGSFTRSQTTSLVTLADGASTVTTSRFNAAGTLTDNTVTQTSADGRSVTISRDANGDGLIDQIEVTTISVEGSSSSVVTDFAANGSKFGKSTNGTSFDGLVTSSQRDIDGDGIIDRTATRAWSDNADGSASDTVQFYKVSQKAANGVITTISPVLEQTVISTVSADGRTQTTSVDVDGNGTIDKTSTTVAKVNGSSVTTTTNNAAARALAPSPGEVLWSSAIASTNKTAATATMLIVSADGLSRTVQADYDGNGTYEHTETWKTQIDGSRVGVITDANASGTIIANGTETISADGLTTTLAVDLGTNGSVDRTERSVIGIDGGKTKTVTEFNADGTFKISYETKVDSNGSHARYVFVGGSANEVLTGGDEDDVLEGGGGADALSGGLGSDTASYSKSTVGVVVNLSNVGLNTGDAAGDTYVGIEGIRGSAFADQLTVAGENMFLYGGGGNDILTISGGGSQIFGEDGNDTIYGAGPTGAFWGGDGNDNIYGYAQSVGRASSTSVKQEFWGGKGDDYIETDYSGDHIYHYGRGDGRDSYLEGSGQDRIVFGAGISLSDLSFEITGTKLNIGLNQLGGSDIPVSWFADNIAIWNWTLNANYRIEKLEFADGSIFALSDYAQFFRGTSANDTIYGAGPTGAFWGGDGNDNIYGYAQSVGRASSTSVKQEFWGGKGDDYIETDYSGDHIYHYGRGDGRDSYLEGSGQDRIVFGAGISLSDLSFEITGTKLNIGLNQLGGSDIPVSWFADNIAIWNWTLNANYRIEKLEFADGSIFALSDYAQFFRGTSANDMQAGGSANDLLAGNAGNDVLDSGAGNDWLVGGSGNDTFVFRSGSGEDGIADFQVHNGTANGDVIELHDQSVTSFAALMLNAEEWSGTTYVHLDNGASITLHNVTMAQLSQSDFRFV